MNKQQIFDEVFENYGEWLEMDENNQILIDILAGLLLRERETVQLLKQEVKRVKISCVY